MSTKKFGYTLTIIGLVGIVLSLLVDVIGLGDDGIGASQLLVLLLGVVISLFGVSLAFAYPEKQLDLLESVRTGYRRLLSLPVAVWVAVGFLVVYILLFLFPVFLNSQRSIIYFNRYIPDKYPIGLDLNITMGVVTPWITTGQSPYPHLFYPPLTYVLFAPMALISYPASYVLITFMTLFSYCSLAILAVLLIAPKQDYTLIALFFLSGVFSYGFQFELERGQFNLITFFLCMFSIYIFYRYHEFRYLAYLLFSISIHIKIYPAIFILMFIRDWRDWKVNIMRLGGLGLFNFALLFVLGYQNFLGFMNAVLGQMRAPGWSWNGNHSTQAFVFNLLKDGYGLIPPDTLAFLQENANHIVSLLLMIILGCVFSVVIRAYLLKENGFNPLVFLVCTLGALIIPTSNDYTLPILVAPIAIFFCSLPAIDSFRSRPLSILLILVISIAYSSILYPFKYKPYFLNNSFPPLLLILLAVTCLYFLRNRLSAFKNDPL